MTKVKICGITTKHDALTALELGANMLGFVFYGKSKRYITTALARDIINELPPSIDRVGVFVDESKDRVLEIAEDASINILQFHGDETPEYCRLFGEYKTIKAFRLKDNLDLGCVNDYSTDYYLFDTCEHVSPGGTGKTFDWKILADFEFLRPIILSGGLTPLNVSQAIEKLSPYAVDVSTGVEKEPGKKDAGLMKKFIENVRRTN